MTVVSSPVVHIAIVKFIHSVFPVRSLAEPERDCWLLGWRADFCKPYFILAVVDQKLLSLIAQSG